MGIVLPEYAKYLMRKYASWLNNRYYDSYARKWGLLCRNDVEAGAMEAATWAILCANNVHVEPHDDTAGGRAKPDFRCKKSGQVFFAETTCMRATSVAGETLLPVEIDLKRALYSRLLTTSIFQVVRAKVTQCSGLDAACLLFVGTFHYSALYDRVEDTVEELLTGSTEASFPFDPVRGEAVGEGFVSSQLANSAFIRFGEGGVEHARCPVSAVVVCGLGCDPPEVFGALHPQPVHPFDPQLLAEVPFCSLRSGYEGGSLSVCWVNRK